MTPKYSGSNAISLINSEAFDAFNITINNGGANCVFSATGIGSPVGTLTNSLPTADAISVTSIRIDHSASPAMKWGMYDSIDFANYDYNFTPSSPLRIGDGAGTDKNQGIELFCKMTSSGASTNAIAELAPPGFIVHEVLMYNRFLTDAEDLSVRQYLEDKYGVDA